MSDNTTTTAARSVQDLDHQAIAQRIQEVLPKLSRRGGAPAQLVRDLAQKIQLPRHYLKRAVHARADPAVLLWVVEALARRQNVNTGWLLFGEGRWRDRASLAALNQLAGAAELLQRASPQEPNETDEDEDHDEDEGHDMDAATTDVAPAAAPPAAPTSPDKSEKGSPEKPFMLQAGRPERTAAANSTTGPIFAARVTAPRVHDVAVIFERAQANDQVHGRLVLDNVLRDIVDALNQALDEHARHLDEEYARTRQERRDLKGVIAEVRGQLDALRQFEDRIGSMDRNVTNLAGRMTTLDRAVRAQVEQIDNRLTAVETQTRAVDALRQDLGALGRRVDEQDTALRNDHEWLANRLDDVEGRPAGAGPEVSDDAILNTLADMEANWNARLEAMGRRVAAMERAGREHGPASGPDAAGSGPFPRFAGDVPALERQFDPDVLVTLHEWLSARGWHQTVFRTAPEKRILSKRVSDMPAKAGFYPKTSDFAGSGHESNLLLRVGDLRSYLAMVDSDRDRALDHWSYRDWAAWWAQHCLPAWEARYGRPAQWRDFEDHTP